MPSLKFSANLSFMFQETSNLLERYALAKEAGFKGVEVAFPYCNTVEEVVQAKKACNAEQVLINGYVDVPKGELGYAALTSPEDEAKFQSSVQKAVTYAKALDCKLIHVMSGAVVSPTPANDAAYDRNITWATRLFEKEGIIGVIEPINRRSVPNYYLSDYPRAVNLIKSIGSPNLKLMLDVFHLQQLHGNLTSNVSSLLKEGLVGHIQIAQVPDRGEPDSEGEVNYKYLLKLLEKEKYNGWIGLEYKPVDGTSKGLKWIKNLGYEL